MLSPEQANAALLAVQQNVIELQQAVANNANTIATLQQGAATNAQNMANTVNTMAMMQGAIATMQAAQVEGPATVIAMM